MATPAAELTIGELAARAGVATSALRYYEAQHLITSRRTSGNQRRYARAMLRRVAFIHAAQAVGLRLDQIRQALSELPEGRTPNRTDWARLSKHWEAELNRRIDNLTRLRDRLTDCIGCGCLSLSRCSLYNNGDELGQEGAGARRLGIDLDA